jgi:protocatechuate 3,4-dioxygenase beta subunit
MINRRDMLRCSAAGAAALLFGESWNSILKAAPASASPALLTPEQEQGPFYIKSEHIRRNISEGRPGVPLDLRLTFVNASNGQPIHGAAIDIWHCDAGGLYSGFTKMKMGPPPDGGMPPDFPGGPGGPGGPPPGMDGIPGHGPGPHHALTDHLNFLRGVQITDAQGRAAFTTIYPGWYAGREIHIHLKVHIDGADKDSRYAGGHVCHTGQLFLPDETNLAISRTLPYASSKTPRTTKETDGVYRGENGEESVMAIRPVSTNIAAGYVAEITLAVDPAASPKAVGMGGDAPSAI